MPGFVFPLLLVVVFLLLMLGVGTLSSYLWLQHLDKNFRKCPQCEQRGVGEIVETVELDSGSEVDFSRKPPRRITTIHFEDHYKCAECGHAWTRPFRETQVERHKVRASR